MESPELGGLLQSVSLSRSSLFSLFIALASVSVLYFEGASATVESNLSHWSSDASTSHHYDFTTATKDAATLLVGQLGQGWNLRKTDTSAVSPAAGNFPGRRKVAGGAPLRKAGESNKGRESSYSLMFGVLHKLMRTIANRWWTDAEKALVDRIQPQDAIASGRELPRLPRLPDLEDECIWDTSGTPSGTCMRGGFSEAGTENVEENTPQKQRAALRKRRQMEEEALGRRWERRNHQIRQRWTNMPEEALRASHSGEVKSPGRQIFRSHFPAGSDDVHALLLNAPKITFSDGSSPYRLLGNLDSQEIDDLHNGFENFEKTIDGVYYRSLEAQTRKTFVRFAGGYVSSYACTMVGRRPTDEDAIVVNITSRKFPNVCLQAIFDGHGGHQAAHFAAKNAARFFGRLESFDAETITKACLSLDAAILQSPWIRRSGATGVLVFIEYLLEPEVVTVIGREIVPEGNEMFKTVAELICQDEAMMRRHRSQSRDCSPRHAAKRLKVGVGQHRFKLTVANIGDSRALLVHQNGEYVRLSRDHKPSNSAEAQRIMNAGGFVDYSDTFRVNGIMALSRAFGDSDMKNNPQQPLDKQLITAIPDVRSFVAKTSDVLLIACDGLYEPEEMTPQFVASMIHKELRQDERPEKILLRLLDTAFEYESGDNISGVLTFFRERRANKEIRKSVTIPGKSEWHKP